MPNTMQCRVPRYGKHRASGQAVVSLNGRDHYLGRHGTPKGKDAYDKLIREWLAGGRRALKIDRLTVARLILANWNAVGKSVRGGRRDRKQRQRGRRHVPAHLPNPVGITARAARAAPVQGGLTELSRAG